MKLIGRTFLILVTGYLLSLYFPWWVVIPVSFLAAFAIPGSYFNVFISGLLGGGLSWLIYAWYLDLVTDSVLSEKIVQLFPVDDKIFLIILSGLIGGIISGFGAMSGNSFRQLFLKKKSQSFYS